MALIIIPLLSPFFSAIALLFLSPRKASAILSLASGIIQTAAAAILATRTFSGAVLSYQVGGWEAPFGISLACDFLSSSFLLAASFTGVVCVSYFLIEQKNASQMQLKLPLLQLLFLGINLSFLTADLFNLFVAFEIMLISSYALMGIDASRTKIPHVLPYVAINLTASMLFLVFSGIIYSYTGTLNMAHLSLFFTANKEFAFTKAACAVALAVFGVKAGSFPLYFWLPHSYSILSPSLAGIYGGILTKVGFYVLLRLFVTVFPIELPFLHNLAIVLGGVTMLLGVFGAIAQNSIRKILSYHIVSQMGYMILGLGLYSPLSIAGSIFFALHNILVKSSLFLVGGVGKKVYGTDTLYQMGTLYSLTPYASSIFLIQALSLAGVPPFSGFWGKLLLTSSAFQEERFLSVFLFILTGIFTLFSMMKIWGESFWGKSHGDIIEPACKKLSALTSLLVIASFAMAFFADPLAENFIKGAKSLLDKKAYTEAILGKVSKEAA